MLGTARCAGGPCSFLSKTHPGYRIELLATHTAPMSGHECNLNASPGPGQRLGLHRPRNDVVYEGAP